MPGAHDQLKPMRNVNDGRRFSGGRLVYNFKLIKIKIKIRKNGDFS